MKYELKYLFNYRSDDIWHLFTFDSCQMSPDLLLVMTFFSHFIPVRLNFVHIKKNNIR